MHKNQARLTRSAWRRVIRLTGLVTAASIAASAILTNAFMEGFSNGINVQGLAVAILMPVVLGSPMMFYLALKHEQLRTAHDRLAIMANTDWLTNCLNRYAFTTQAQDDLAAPLRCEGALLIIDADDFKAVNDRFGHQAGDEALRAIAEAIRTNVRSTDLVGRLGGEEFGVFLSEASTEIADQVAERIRSAVKSLAFTHANQPCALSVSIGGASFARPARFEDLYRLADQRLYDAKDGGRDQVAMMRAA